MTGTGRPAIIIAATPTPNGDLHVGHLAGPYLAGDIYARYLRAIGRSVIYTTCTDDSQSYVVATAAKRATTPRALCEASTTAIQNSLAAMGISMTALPPIDERYRQSVLSFVTRLYDTGRLQARTVRLPFAEHSGTYLFDGLVTGSCPVCLAGSCGGTCENCGHPNSFDELLDPRSTIDPAEPVHYREHTVLVLPMEDYRERLSDYFAARQDRWRPHSMHLIRELLAGPLPEIPVTMPGRGWGIAAPFAETPGQILYPWIEAMPASMYSTWWAAGQQGQPQPAAFDEQWLAEHNAEVVYFHGFDNTYHWGLMDLVLLMAHGDRYVLPESNVCNEFYNLDGAKFSTSRNHLIRGTDLLVEMPRDLVRFYLALTAPEYQRTNFTQQALREVTEQRLVEPWNALAEAISLLMADRSGTTLATTPAGRARAALMLARLRGCYELGSYSVARAAETIIDQLARLRTAAEDGPAEPGDLLLEARTLLAGAAPILIGLAEQAIAAGLELDLTAEPAGSVPAFELPRLACHNETPDSPAAELITRTPALDGAV
ncbi:MAG TPA: class I tRNA ligase family protein [Jatrophihabitans sp.]|jgi:methionyl-tRNA synthetase|nr:class I tRNA ligase family protein [Jatrophihabitans sp.]